MTTKQSFIAGNIKLLRHRLGLTQSELAEKAEISNRGLQNIEYKRTKNPRSDMLEKIAKALGVSMVDLLKDPVELGNFTIGPNLGQIARSPEDIKAQMVAMKELAEAKEQAKDEAISALFEQMKKLEAQLSKINMARATDEQIETVKTERKAKQVQLEQENKKAKWLDPVEPSAGKTIVIPEGLPADTYPAINEMLQLDWLSLYAVFDVIKQFRAKQLKTEQPIEEIQETATKKIKRAK